MIKFLLVSITFFLLYLGFSILSSWDSMILLDVYNYHIETTCFTIIIGWLLTLILSLLILRIVFLLFELPYMIRRKLQLNKAQKTHNALLKASAYLMQQQERKAIELTKKIFHNLNQVQKDFAHLILANAEKDFDEQIAHLRILLSNSEYEYYATKKLAILFSTNSLYEQAEEYGIKCYNLNEKDLTILIALSECYAQLKKWDRFDFIVGRLYTLHQPDYLSTEIISTYYLIAAKENLNIGQEKQADKYLGKSLEANPCNVEALDLYIVSNANKEKTEDILEMLKNAYKKEPSFEIAQLIIRSLADTPPEKIYEQLSEIVESEEFPVMYLAIVAYLGLESKNTNIAPKFLN